MFATRSGSGGENLGSLLRSRLGEDVGRFATGGTTTSLRTRSLERIPRPSPAEAGGWRHCLLIVNERPNTEIPLAKSVDYRQILRLTTPLGGQ
eukprot:s2729_g8.t1